MEVAERRLRLAHAKRHQLAGRVVDVDQEHTTGSAVLEPVVVAAIDLHELAVAIPAVTRLLDAFATLRTGLPNAVRNHPFAKRLGRDSNVVVLQKLLRSERRPEVRVALAHQTEDVLLVRLRNPIGCRSAAALVSQACRSVSFKRSQQPPNLTLASVETTRRLGLRHASLCEPREDRQVCPFLSCSG